MGTYFDPAHMVRWEMKVLQSVRLDCEWIVILMIQKVLHPDLLIRKLLRVKLLSIRGVLEVGAAPPRSNA
jgi:hypothetical protein